MYFLLGFKKYIKNVYVLEMLYKEKFCLLYIWKINVFKFIIKYDEKCV